MTLKEGHSYTLSHAEGLGQGVGSIPTGTVVKIESLHKEPTAGVVGEVVFAFPAATVEVDGQPVEILRRVAISHDDFKRLFEKAGK